MDFEKERRQEERAAKRTQDLDDLHNEMAGRDVGRINRFFGEASAPRSERGKQKAEREVQLTNLQVLLMNDPEYAQLFRETETKLRQGQNRLLVLHVWLEDPRAGNGDGICVAATGGPGQQGWFPGDDCVLQPWQLSPLPDHGS